MEKRTLEEISTNAALQVRAAVFSLQAEARLLRAEGRTERRSAIHPQRIFTLNTELSVLPVASVQLRPPLAHQCYPYGAALWNFLFS